MRPACWMLTVILLGVVVGAGCSTYQGDTGQADTRQVVYEVFGMDCPGCHGGLEKNVCKIPGVVGAEANWMEQSVTIDLSPEAQVEPEQVRQAIRDSNFSPGEDLN